MLLRSLILGADQWAIGERNSDAPKGWERATLRSFALKELVHQAAPLLHLDTDVLEHRFDAGSLVLFRRVPTPIRLAPVESGERKEASSEAELTFVEVQLLDLQGQPLPNQRYEVTLPNGSKRAGKLDDQGVARIESIDTPGQCQFRFPDLQERYWQYAWGRA